MKKYFVVITSVIIIMPMIVFANTMNQTQKITLEQKGEFQSVMHLNENDFVVPTVVDVPIDFSQMATKDVIVTDVDGLITPSVVIQNTVEHKLQLSVHDSFELKMARNVADGNMTTFSEYPFVEGANTTSYTDKEQLQEELVMLNEQNKVDIDITSAKPFSSDSFTIYLDEHVANPTSIRVVSVDMDDNEKVLLPEKTFTQHTIVFPEEYTDHYRITLRYNQPLRINEIVFKEKKAPTTTQDFVRFIAQPKMAYDIYYNAYEHVKTEVVEAPNLYNQKNIKIVKVSSDKSNSLYKKADEDKDGIVDSLDNCVKVSNVDQIDLDENGVGDACEDFDKDGIINSKDNCQNVANNNQRDTDVDGIGDTCDSEESRFMEKNPWIPYIVLAMVFGVVVGLIVKTLKSED